MTKVLNHCERRMAIRWRLQKIHMTLEMLLEERYQWQNNTIERIGRQLSHKPEYSRISEQEKMEDSALKNIIAAMSADSDEYARQQLVAIEEKMQDLQQQIKAVEEEIVEKEKQIPDYESVLANHKEAVSKYRFVRDTDIHFSIKEYKNKLIKYMDSSVVGKGKDDGKKLARVCENQIKRYISDTLQQTISVYIGMESCEEVYRSIAEEIPVEAELEKILSPSGWIPMFDKVYRIKCSFQIEDLFIRIEKTLNSIYKMKKSEYLKQNRETKEEYDQYSQLRKDCKRDIEQCRNQIADLTAELQDKLTAKKTLEENSKKDQECLTNYVAVSTREFTKQKKRLLDHLEGLSPEEQVSTLLFIALLEKDFNNIIGNEVMG